MKATILRPLFANAHFPSFLFSRQDFSHHVVLKFLESRLICAPIAGTFQNFGRSKPVLFSAPSLNYCMEIICEDLERANESGISGASTTLRRQNLFQKFPEFSEPF
jgi:hypothetical protein